MDSKFRVNEVIQKSNNPDHPFLVTFQNGDPFQIKGSKRGYKITIDQANEKKKKLELKCENGHVYSGCDVSKDGPRLFCIVRKKGIPEAKMYEVGAVSMLNDKFTDVTTRKEYGADVVKARTAALNRSFAGKQQLRRMDQREKLKLNTASLEKTLNDSVKGIEPKVEASPMSVQIEESMMDLLPPCNRQATDPNHVYDLKRIFGEEFVTDCLLKIEELLDSKRNQYVESFPPFIRQLWNNAALSKVNRNEKAVATVLIDSLCRLVKTKANQLRRQSFSPDPSVHDKLMEMFTASTSEGVSRSNKMRDKTLCHILALCFIAGENTFKLNGLVSAVNVSSIKLTSLCRAVGGTEIRYSGVKKDSQEERERIFQLKIPLPPIPSFGGARRRTMK